MRSIARPDRVERAGRYLLQRRERRTLDRELRRSRGEEVKLTGNRPLRRLESVSKPKRLIAYDLETDRIKAGSPMPRYITSFGEGNFLSMRILDLRHLGEVLENYFLTPELKGTRFVAWNGNHFDAYLVGAALLHKPEYILRPYLTRGKQLRGMRVQLKCDPKINWEFLDGMSMTGILKSLKDFLKTFAPDHQKLAGPDFEKEDFDYQNISHVEYAERDSQGLYFAMEAAQKIVFDAFGVPLQPTIGNTAIRIFQRYIPWRTVAWRPRVEILNIVRRVVMRGGFCHCMRRYRGPIWKYDLNQAYAAAMRDSWLPAGTVYHKAKSNKIMPFAMCAIYRITARSDRNQIPFYYTRALDRKRFFGMREIQDTWITSTEAVQLQREGWKIVISDCYYWDDPFTMKEYVDRLEKLRGEAPGGPGDAHGTMIKYVGNNSYGKTVEVLGGIELVMSKEKPAGYHDYQAEDDQFRHIWYKFSDPVERPYHQPQIGAFITAHVRMEVRRAALCDPASFLYADTDCVVFDRPAELNLDPKKYGFWKQEVAGEIYMILDKKVYANRDATVKHAKGMNVSRLTQDDFESWERGVAPIQVQLQRQNFLKVMTGGDMFVSRSKTGSKTGQQKSVDI